MWKYWQDWQVPGVAWECWKTWNLIIICACLFWSCLIFMSYETRVFRSRHREEFLCKQIIVINCSHNTTVNEQLPRAVQTHRQAARIAVLSAVFLWKLPKMSKPRLFSSPEWSHTLSWVAGLPNCNSRKRQEKAPMPSLSFSCSSSYHFHARIGIQLVSAHLRIIHDEKEE